jgi:hypothetical protein
MKEVIHAVPGLRCAGIPAVGKYTTAKAIGELTGAKVVDDQLINYVAKIMASR